MYKNNYSIKFVKIMLLLDLNVMYKKVVEIDEHYFFIKDNFEIY